MTAREVFEYALIEMNKQEAPSLLLEDYNYFINKAIIQYVNKAYNMYDLNQQKTDDLRVLKSTAFLTLTKSTAYTDLGDIVFNVTLPADYYHCLSCVVVYSVKKQFKCYDVDDKITFGARRLTADMFSQIINNHYMRPMYKRPYFFINNASTVANVDGTVTMEIRYGKDDATFLAEKVMIDYVRTPTKIRLTQDQIDETSDSSQDLEFPEYACQEIVNELVKLLLENSSDPRLGSNIPINQTIAPPVQIQQQMSQQQAQQ